jgi:hypothetical protein
LSPALIAVAILILGTTTAQAGVSHTTGFNMAKTCPTTVASGAVFFCSVTIANRDDQHGVINLTLTNQVPFPAGPITNLDCRQPFDAAECGTKGGPTGTIVTELGPAGSPDAGCGACIEETAPFNCNSSNISFVDEVRASGTDAASCTSDPPSPFCNLPVSSATTNATPVAPHVCNDNDVCTTDNCVATDPDGCVFTPGALDCNDNDPCTSDECVPGTGCVNTPGALDCNDNDPCTSDECVPGTGCVNTPGALDCNDNDPCTSDECVPGTGCVNTPGALDCNDNDVCTDDECVPGTGCVNTRDNTNDPSCVPGEEICRTPGFFGTHGGVEKTGSTNITLALLNAYNAANDPDLTICGRTITNTTVGSVNSALEAICVSPKGNSVLQLARQLTAAALNCILTNGGDGVDSCVSLTGDVCAGVSIEDVFNACNTACAAGDVTATIDSTEVNCIEVIDCFNNGGETFIPIIGCIGDSGCHDRELDNGCVDFSPPGPAGSPRACNDARKNDVIILVP